MQSQAHENNLRLLEQGLALLENLDKAAYSVKSPLGASVGSHIRHIVDFYQCFLRDVASLQFDYDCRARDAVVEQDLDVAVRRLKAILDSFGAATFDPQAECLCKTEASQPPEFARSTIQRELQHLHAHTVHHFALISYILTAYGISIPNGFGIAPSTLAYLQEESLAG
ncbi:MAG: DinB family protein [Leptospirales bacterium]|nr:DinB family protein [Leptospirales bacterium]